MSEGFPGETLSTRASRGFLWVFVNSASSKLISLVGQLVLARLLAPEDFGLIGLALTVTAFASLIEQAGITEVLVQRQKDFARLVSPAFWLALFLGVFAALLKVGMAPIAAAIYGEPRLERMLFILAIASPFAALQCITRAVFLTRLEFRLIAMGGIAQSVSYTTLTVAFAFLGFGALSFVLPYPITAAGGLLFQWLLAKPKITEGLRPGKWKLLLGDSTRMLAASLVVMLTSQGDYILLGVLQPAAIVGLYVFAFNLSAQAVALFTRNIAKVLFPTLSRLQSDLEAQTKAYLSVASMLAVVGAPIAFLQAATADSVVRVLFDAKWYPAIPYLQILSVGMVFRTVGSTAGSLLQAQGRFAFRLALSVAYAAVFFSMIGLGYLIGGVIGLAMGASFYYLVTGLVHPRIVTRAGGASWSQILAIFAMPVAMAAAAVGVSAGAAAAVFGSFPNHLARIGLIVFGTLSLYIPGIRLLAPATFNQIVFHVWSLKRSRRVKALP